MSRKRKPKKTLPSNLYPNARWDTAIQNSVTYTNYFDRLMNMAMNVFKWENLPDTCDARFLELQLFSQGFCLFFKDEIEGYLTLGGECGGELDVYNIPIHRTAHAPNGYMKSLTKKDSVIIWNNYLHQPNDLYIRDFAIRLYEIERAIDTNVRGSKTARIVQCSENDRLSYQNIMMEYDGNVPIIFLKDNIAVNNLNVEDISVPYLADKLEVLKHQIWNEALTFLGIENSNEDKKERLVADEVGSNYGAVEVQRNVMLNMRERACDEINKMFGLNISVRYNSDVNTLVNNPNTNNREGDVT